MDSATEIAERQIPVERGVYYMQDVANLLNATDSGIRGRPFCVRGATVRGWGSREFFYTEKNQYMRHRSFMRFGGVITSRMVSLLRSYGVHLDRIRLAHEFLRVETGLRYPFASRRFWVETQDVSHHVYAELDNLVVTANKYGQMTFTQLLYGEIEYPDDMGFDDSEHSLVTSWTPVPGITINPFFQSGAACLTGTRIPTYALYGCYVGGDSPSSIACAYELTDYQVETALSWEGSLLSASSLA